MKKSIETKVQSKKNLTEKDGPGEMDMQNSFFDPAVRLVILIIMFAAAFMVRIYGIDQAPLNFHPNRQYHSAMIARAFYYSHTNSVTRQQKEIAKLNREQEVKGELPILEYVASIAYRIAGGEYLWFPKLTSVIFWLIGGLFLYFFVSRILNYDGAILSAGFFLFLPYVIEASRSFQPNPMMIMLLIISITVVYRYFEQETLKKLFIAAGVSALTLFVYPTSVFPVVMMIVFLAFYTKGFVGAFKSGRLWLLGVITVLPTAIYYSYMIFLAGNIKDYSKVAFQSHILGQEFFWRGWLFQIDNVIGLTALIGGLLGLFFFEKRLARVMLCGLWFSYVVYSFLFSYHTATHNYYQLPLVPTVAICLGGVGSAIAARLSRTSRKWYSQILVLTIFFFGVFLSIYAILPKLNNPGNKAYVETLEGIGDVVGHSRKTMFLTDFYGKPLQYHGEISGLNWPNSGDFRAWQNAKMPIESTEERFKRFSGIQNDSEFFIITDFSEFELQPDLKQFLTKKFPVLTQNRSYVIFDLRKKLTGK